MKQIFALVFIIILSVNAVNCQDFNLIRCQDYKNISYLFDTVENSSAKVVFIEDNPVLLYTKGVLAEDKVVKYGDIFSLNGFSDVDYDYVYKQKNYKLPYLKISDNTGSYWLHGSYPFIFDDAHPICSYEFKGITYNVLAARKLYYIVDEEFYDGYDLLLIKNTSNNTYKFIQNKEFPDVLEGHSYGNRYLYMQNDMGVVEEITKVSVDNTTVTFDVVAHYQEGKATYKISFDPLTKQPETKYWRVQLAK